MQNISPSFFLQFSHLYKITTPNMWSAAPQLFNVETFWSTFWIPSFSLSPLYLALICRYGSGSIIQKDTCSLFITEQGRGRASEWERGRERADQTLKEIHKAEPSQGRQHLSESHSRATGKGAVTPKSLKPQQTHDPLAEVRMISFLHCRWFCIYVLWSRSKKGAQRYERLKCLRDCFGATWMKVW